METTPFEVETAPIEVERGVVVLVGNYFSGGKGLHFILSYRGEPSLIEVEVGLVVMENEIQVKNFSLQCSILISNFPIEVGSFHFMGFVVKHFSTVWLLHADGCLAIPSSFCVMFSCLTDSGSAFFLIGSYLFVLGVLGQGFLVNLVFSTVG